MAFKFVFFIFATFLVMESNAYVRRELVPHNTDYPDKCFVEKHGMVLEFGKSYPIPMKCERMLCGPTSRPGNNKELLIEGCIPIPVQPPCKLSQVNLQKVYPHCCPVPIC